MIDGLKKLEKASDFFQLQLENAQRIRNQKIILHSLKGSLVDKRYHEVLDAASKTFEWIFEDSKLQKKSNSRLKRPFKDWLSSGDGIFHISGKPAPGNRR
jgi:hypothetical protein